jgi:hypothetical protein
MTPNVIEDKENRLRDLPFDELAEMFIQEGFVCREEMIERIIERMVRNHHPVTEERYQFVLWLYRIRNHHGNHYGFLQPDFICIIFGKMMVSKYQRFDADIHKAVNDWCGYPAEATIKKYGHSTSANGTHLESLI